MWLGFIILSVFAVLGHTLPPDRKYYKDSSGQHADYEHQFKDKNWANFLNRLPYTEKDVLSKYEGNTVDYLSDRPQNQKDDSYNPYRVNNGENTYQKQSYNVYDENSGLKVNADKVLYEINNQINLYEEEKQNNWYESSIGKVYENLKPYNPFGQNKDINTYKQELPVIQYNENKQKNHYDEKQPLNKYDQNSYDQKKRINTYEEKRPYIHYEAHKDVNSYEEKKPINKYQENVLSSYDLYDENTGLPYEEKGTKEINYEQLKPYNKYDKNDGGNTYKEEKANNWYGSNRGKVEESYNKYDTNIGKATTYEKMENIQYKENKEKITYEEKKSYNPYKENKGQNVFVPKGKEFNGYNPYRDNDGSDDFVLYEESSHQPQAVPYDQPQAVPYDQLKVVSYDQPQAVPYVQPLVVPYNQPQNERYEQPQAVSHDQPQAVPYYQPHVERYDQPKAVPYNQPQVERYFQPHVELYDQPQAVPYVQPLVAPYNQPQVVPNVQPQAVPYYQPHVEHYEQPQDEHYDQPQNERYDQLQVVSHDQPQAVPYYQPHVELYDQPKAVPYNQPQVERYEQPQVVSHDQPQAVPYNKPQVERYDQPQAVPYNQLQVERYDQPQVVYHDQLQAVPYYPPHVERYDQPKAVPYNQPQVERYEQPQAVTHEQPQAVSHDQPQAVPFYQPHLKRYDQPQALPYNEPQVERYDQPQAVPYNQPLVERYDQPQVVYNDQLQAVPYYQPHVERYDQPQSVSYNQPQVERYDQPQVIPRVQPQAVTYDHAQVIPYDNAQKNDITKNPLDTYERNYIDTVEDSDYINPSVVKSYDGDKSSQSLYSEDLSDYQSFVSECFERKFATIKLPSEATEENQRTMRIYSNDDRIENSEYPLLSIANETAFDYETLRPTPHGRHLLMITLLENYEQNYWEHRCEGLVQMYLPDSLKSPSQPTPPKNACLMKEIRVDGKIWSRQDVLNVFNNIVASRLSKSQTFSRYKDEHSKSLQSLVKFALWMPDFDSMMSLLVVIRDSCNKRLFLEGLASIIQAREDVGFIIPSLISLIPEQFLPLDDISSSSNGGREDRQWVGQGRGGQVIRFGSTHRTYPANEPEGNMWHIREDPVYSSMHWLWHVVLSDGNTARLMRRRGEMFFFMHRQMLNRYNADRLAVGLRPVTPYLPQQWTQPGGLIGYTPHPLLSGYSGRASNRAMPGQAAAQLRRDRTALMNAVQRGVIGGTRLGYAGGVDNGISALGDATEPYGNNRGFGSFHNQGHVVISAMSNGRPGVMGGTENAIKDPAFFRWHEEIDTVFSNYKRNLGRYSANDLDFNGVRVTGLNTVSQAGATNRLTTLLTVDSLQINNENLVTRRGGRNINIERITYEPFVYNIELESTIEGLGVGRIFLVPSNYANGDCYEFAIEMDKFLIRLTRGTNTIQRTVNQSPIFSTAAPSLNNLQGNLLRGMTERDFNWARCGYPSDMALPRGTRNGMSFQLVFIASPLLQQDRARVADWQRTETAWGWCGFRDGQRGLPCSRPLGFPFDRHMSVPDITNGRSNAASTTITIVHNG